MQGACDTSAHDSGTRKVDGGKKSNNRGNGTTGPGGRKEQAAPTSQKGSTVEAGLAALRSTIFPTATELMERGEPGTAESNTIGALKEFANAGLASAHMILTPSNVFLGFPAPHIPIANNQLEGAAGMEVAVVIVGVASGGEAAGARVGSAGLRGAGAAKGGMEVVQRAMARAELEATESTGLLRGGRGGTHYASDAVNSDALRARQRLALGGTPEVRVTMEVPAGRFSAPSRVQPLNNMPGGGMERTATGNIPAKVLRVDEY